MNGTNLQYEATGEREWGEESVLLDQAIDLTAATDWHANGFTIETLFDASTYAEFVHQTQLLLLRRWREAGLALKDNFQLDQYHTLIKGSRTHLQAVEKTKLLPSVDFPVPIQIIEDRVSEICKTRVAVGNPYDAQSVFHFRVIRPNYSDNNPLHRDVWLEDYDDCINLYIPVAGSDERSSLILIPGSHCWPESRIEKTSSGAEINGVKFNVPAVTAIRDMYRVERPNPFKNQLLVFSPYLIHGGAVNLNTDKTRISIEMRLWKK